MSAALLAAGAEYLAARRAYQDALDQLHQASQAMKDAESNVIEVVMNHDDEDGGTAFVCQCVVLMVKPEYWNLPHGERIATERLLEVGS